MNNIYCQTINDLSKTVVFLQKEFQSYEMKAGEKVEVWYKNPSSGKYEPKLNKFTGTGFLLNHNGRDYLITAKHVAAFCDSSAEILINTTKDRRLQISFDVLRKYMPIINKARWFYHPTADIALHPIAYTLKPDQLAIPKELIREEEIKIKLLTDVIVLGFPLGQGIHDVLTPIAKMAKIASDITPLDFPDINPKLKFYLLDQALAQGYSGSPVFCSEEILSGVSIGEHPLSGGDKITLIGIVSLSMSDINGGKISAVVPISYIREIFNSKDFIEYEKGLPK